MAKKKKKKAGKQTALRGYEQGATASTATAANNQDDIPVFVPKSTAAVVVALNNSTNQTKEDSQRLQKVQITTKSHEYLEELLETLQTDNIPAHAPPHRSPSQPVNVNRFRKKLATICGDLLRVGFAWNQIQDCVVAVGYDLTLETALDWLCLSLPTPELPALFTEGQVRDDSRSNVNKVVNSLSVVAPISNTSKVISRDPPTITTITTSSIVTDPHDRQRDAMFTAKSLAESKSKNKSLTEEEERQRAKQKVLEYLQNDTNDEGNQEPKVENDARALTETELLLRNKRAELEEVEADVNDEAGNYMRSKQEVKELRKKAKELKQLVTGLERKVEREQRQLAAASEPQPEQEEEEGMSPMGLFGPNEEEEEEEEEEEDYMGGINSLFSKGTDSSASPAFETPKAVIDIPIDAVPKNWTGKTPKVILEEHCRKDKLSRPRFKKLPLDGCEVSVELGRSQASSDSLVVKVDGPISSYANAQHYVSTKLLYQWKPDQSLYLLLPPFYNDLWKRWVNEEQITKTLSIQKSKDLWEASLDELIALLEKSHASGPRVDIKHRPKDPQEEDPINDLSSALDSWDNDSSSSNRVENVDPRARREGERLQKYFKKLQKSESAAKMRRQRSELPIALFKEDILQTIRDNPVTILCAETGAGKTTQCPQFLLEAALEDGDAGRTSIICTQPRRVAATSVSERVAEEIGENSVGGLIGYQIRLESRRSADTKLLFCTTGIILRRLVEDPSLSGVTHIIVDEVHERQWQIDVLLISLRNLLNGPRRDLKVLLMSATLDSKLFCSFFNGAPFISVPGRTYPVSNYYLEDLLEETGHVIEEGSLTALREYRRPESMSLLVSTRGGEKRKETVSLDCELEIELSDDFVGYTVATRRSMDRVDETVINFELIEDLLQLLLFDDKGSHSLQPPDGTDLSNGAILVFLPGKGEIKGLMERLGGSRLFGRNDKFHIVPLHSSLSPKDQRRAFRIPPKGCRKIILSTNVAETSVTIPDVVCVIDCGRVRELQTDKKTSTPKLVPTWCSRASTKQRSGRAGRTQPGLCLKLFSSRTEKIVMKDRADPELRRVPLEEVCLNVLAAGMTNNCWDFLSQAPQPPREEAVAAAIASLIQIGALTSPHSDETEAGSETLTPLGRHLVKLPVDARIGKMLIFGSLFKCIDTILTVAATLSGSQSPFVSFLSENNAAIAAHSSFKHPYSDFLTMVSVYDAYREADRAGRGRKFCKEKYLNFNALREIGDARHQYAALLAGIGFLERVAVDDSKGDTASPSWRPFNINAKSEAVLNSVIFSGLYPNVAVVESVSKGKALLLHRNERLEIHSSSVNARFPTSPPSLHIAFHEKFGTVNRVSVSSTCFVDPFAIMLFGPSIEVQHLRRKVCVDGWIDLSISAKTGVMFREVRKLVDALLKSLVDNISSTRDGQSIHELDAIAGLLALRIDFPVKKNSDGGGLATI